MLLGSWGLIEARETQTLEERTRHPTRDEELRAARSENNYWGSCRNRNEEAHRAQNLNITYLLLVRINTRIPVEMWAWLLALVRIYRGVLSIARGRKGHG